MRHTPADCFEVIEGGLASTLQDGGRPGYGAYGVSEGGAMDGGAMRAANLACGNRPDAVALEFTMTGPRLRWGGDSPVRCSLYADDTLTLLTLAGGRELECGRLKQRARGYLAVAGGFDAPPALGGRGTCLAGGFGGIFGRTLQAGDLLPLGSAAGNGAAMGSRTRSRGGRAAGRLSAPKAAGHPGPIRVLPPPAPGGDRILDQLLRAEWRVRTGDRVGLQLAGPRLRAKSLDMSIPLCAGAIQATGGGQPILLLRDHPTSGGYPLAGVVITADLDRCGQLRPGDVVRFDAVSESDAIAALRRA